MVPRQFNNILYGFRFKDCILIKYAPNSLSEPILKDQKMYAGFCLEFL